MVQRRAAWCRAAATTLVVSLTTSSAALAEVGKNWQHPFGGAIKNVPKQTLHGRFLHFTDMHPDKYYTPGASVNDACHRLADIPQANRELARDVSQEQERRSLKKGRKKSARVGHWGAPVSVCDSPKELIESTLDWLSDNWMATSPSDEKSGKGIDYIIWTGDTARHDIDATHPRNAGEIFDYNRWVLSLVEAHFPGIPIVPNLGNNDIIPHNIMFPGPNVMTRAYTSIWKDHIPESQQSTFEKGGYFAKEVIDGDLAIISLNTLYWYNSNAAVRGCKGRHDPGTIHLDWVEETLAAYRNRSVQVQLIGHVPPTSNNFFDNCYERYTDMMLRYQDTILGQHFGHMNIDAWYLQKDPDSKRRSLQDGSNEDGPSPADLHSIFYAAPSIVPTYLPSVRVWTYNTTRPTSDTMPFVQTSSVDHFKKSHRGLPHHTSPESPSRTNRYLSLLGYSQWVLDLERANRQYRKEKRRGKTHAGLEYQLQYTTYTADTLWADYLEGESENLGYVPVPRHLLDGELRRLKARSPSQSFASPSSSWPLSALWTKAKIKVPHKLRHLTRYSLPDFSVDSMLQWADTMKSCKSLSKSLSSRQRRTGKTGIDNNEGVFCRMKGGGFLYKTADA